MTIASITLSASEVNVSKLIFFVHAKYYPHRKWTKDAKRRPAVESWGGGDW